MTLMLSGLIIITSVWLLFFIVRKLKKNQFKTNDAFFWIIFSILLLLLSVFPDIGIICANVLGIQSTVNFVFLVIIFLLIVRSFLLTVRITVLEAKLTGLVQEIAVKNNELEKK